MSERGAIERDIKTVTERQPPRIEANIETERGQEDEDSTATKVKGRDTENDRKRGNLQLHYRR